MTAITDRTGDRHSTDKCPTWTIRVGLLLGAQMVRIEFAYLSSVAALDVTPALLLAEDDFGDGGRNEFDERE